jgi:suppressor for copper-sensitivity B
MRCVRTIFAAAAVALAWSAAAVADDGAASAWISNAQSELRLVSAVTAVGDARDIQVGLQFHLKPGWKIYWRSPGDAGLPPTIDWKGSDNLAGVDIAWPAPHRFSYSGLETVGYEDEVVLPIAAHPASPGQPLGLRAKVDYLVCAEICVPRHADLALTIPAGPAAASDEAHLVGRFLARVPGPPALQGFTLESLRTVSSNKIEVTVTAQPPLVAPDLFAERADLMQFDKPMVRLEAGGTRAVFTLRAEPGTGHGGLTDQPITLTIVDGDRGMTATAPVVAGAGAGIGLVAMLGIALLGGLILNLMPCVLPVLSLKLLALVGHGGAEARTIRANFLASAAGILVSFLVLAGAAIAARSAGVAVGWGVQFQQPLFLAGMVALLALFSANLFGFYEIPLPAWAIPEAIAHHEVRGFVAHFLQGAFATLLATPCSAPFLGTAVGFALARGPGEIVAIFAALGTGMAIPYAAVAAWPRLVRYLPHPGRWMLMLRAALGVALVATAIWFLFVLGVEAGMRVAIAVAAAMAAILLVLGVGRRLAAALRIGAVAILVVGAAGAVAGWTMGSSQASPVAAAIDGHWHPFDRAAIDRATAAGKLTFVDVTADWCLTCKVNEQAVLGRGQVASRLDAPDIVAMRADWTRPDPAIAAFLADHGRYGIPFYAVYGPGAPGGIALSELLTDSAVLDALAKAAKPAS